MSKQYPLFLLPGFHGSANLFSRFISHLDLADNIHVLPFSSEISIERHAKTISEKLPANDVLILAESFSGLIALKLLAENPGRFRAAILSTAFARTPMSALAQLGATLPSFFYKNSPIKKLILKHFCLNNSFDRQLEEDVLTEISTVSPNTIKRRIEVLAKTDLRDSLAHVHTPTLCLAASNDRVVPAALVRQLANALSHAELVELEGPHLLLQARAREAAVATSSFLNRVLCD